MSNPRYRYFCGIDVGKRKHAACLLDEQGNILFKALRFANDAAGFATLHQRLQEHCRSAPVLVGMEATGHYWYALHDQAGRWHYPRVVLNRLQTAQQIKNAIRKHKSHGNAGRTSKMEQDLLLKLKGILPPGLKVIILADRGFFKTRLFAFCQKHQLHYVIRIKADLTVEAQRFEGNLLDLPVKPGDGRFWRGVLCGQRPLVRQNLVIYYQQGLPEKRDEPWFLATDLAGRPEQLVTLYGKQMRIEECFRDTKSLRNGMALRHCQIKLPERLDRWLLVLMLAYVIVCGLGLWAIRHLHRRHWSGSTKANECSLYTIGSRVLTRAQVPLDELLALLTVAIFELSPKWG